MYVIGRAEGIMRISQKQAQRQHFHFDHQGEKLDIEKVLWAPLFAERQSVYFLKKSLSRG